MENEQLLQQIMKLFRDFEQNLKSNQHLMMLETSQKVANRLELSLAASELRKLAADIPTVVTEGDDWLRQRLLGFERVLAALEIRIAKLEARRKPEES